MKVLVGGGLSDRVMIMLSLGNDDEIEWLLSFFNRGKVKLNFIRLVRKTYLDLEK